MATNDPSFVHLHPLRTMLSFSGTRTAIPPFSNGVYLNPHAESGVTLMACDGQTMGVWHDADGYAASAAVYIPYDQTMLARFATLGSDGEEDFVTIDTERERMELFEAPTGFVHAQYKARISWLEAALSLTRGQAPTSSWANSDIIACEPLNWAGIAASSLRSYRGFLPRFNMSLLDQFRTIGGGIAVTPLSTGTNALIVTVDSAPNFVGLLFGDDPAASGLSDPSPVARMLSIMNLEFVP